MQYMLDVAGVWQIYVIKIILHLAVGHACTVYIFLFCVCMFYQVLCVPYSRSSTQSWGSVLPSIVGMRDQNSRGCPLLFLNRNLGSFCA